MKHTVKIFLWSLWCLAMTACFQTDETLTPNEGGTVGITFTAVTAANTAAATRALSNGADELNDENTVNKILVLMFDGSTPAAKYLGYVAGTDITQGSAADKFHAKTFKAKVHNDSRSFVFVANVDVTSDLSSFNTDATVLKSTILAALPFVGVTAIENWKDDVNYLPMWGECTLTEPLTASSTTITNAFKLLRMVAAIDIKSEVGNIAEVHFINGYNKGQIYPNALDGNKVTSPSIPPIPSSGVARCNQTLTSFTATDNFTGQLYAFEADHTGASPYVAVKLEGKTGYFRLNFNDGTNNLPLLRNHRYTFTITSVTGSGGSTKETAIAGNMEYTFKWGSDIEKDLEASQTIVNTKGHFISISRDKYNFGYKKMTAPVDEEESKLIIRTNCPDGLSWSTNGKDDYFALRVGQDTFDVISQGETTAYIARLKSIYLNDPLGNQEGVITLTSNDCDAMSLSVDITQYAPVLYCTLLNSQTDDDTPIEIFPHNETLIIPYDLKTYDVLQVTTNLPGWTVKGIHATTTSDIDYVTLGSRTGTMPVLAAAPVTDNMYTVYIEENTTYDDRTFHLVLSSDEFPVPGWYEHVVTITQRAGGYFPSYPGVLSITKDGEIRNDLPIGEGYMLYFKFGSVIGFVNPDMTIKQQWDNKYILYNPSDLTVGTDPEVDDITGYGNYGYVLPDIPSYDNEDLGDLDNSNGPTRKISNDEYHNLENIKRGKGDPCRLVGMTVAQIQALKTDADLYALEASVGGWRSPTRDENKTYAGMTGADGSSMYNNYPYYPYYAAQSQTFADPALGWFPIGGPNGTGTAGRFLNDNNAGNSNPPLPAAGSRSYYYGVITMQGVVGNYWTAEVYYNKNDATNSLRGFYQSFTPVYIVLGASLEPAHGLGIRCTRKQ